MPGRAGFEVLVEFRCHRPDKRAAVLRYDEVFTIEPKQKAAAADGKSTCHGQESLADVAEAFDQFDRREGEMAHQTLDDPASCQIVDAELDAARHCQLSGIHDLLVCTGRDDVLG